LALNDIDNEVWDLIWTDSIIDAIEKEEVYWQYVHAEMKREQKRTKERVCLEIIVAAHIISIASVFIAALCMR